MIEPISRKSYIVTPILKIHLIKKTKYQNVAVLELAEFGKSLVLDGYVQSSAVDEHYYHESLVHPVMTAHSDPKRVLIIGGGEGATLREVLKHDTVERAVMVDIDGELIEISKRYLWEFHQGVFDDPRAEILIQDGREYIEKTGEKFDVIILDLVDPFASEIAAQLYTEPFYKKVLERLNDNGIMVTQSGSSFYYPDEYFSVLSAVRNVFPIVNTYGLWVPVYGYVINFIAGSRKVDLSLISAEEIDRRLKERGVKTRIYSGKTHLSLINMPLYLRGGGAEDSKGD